ncbi:MAG: translation initiation factor IF-6 [Methanomicrobiaceae archaeon]|nr:translation initiation factor IF-6 [Methanomicrobiaceae archaeon]
MTETIAFSGDPHIGVFVRLFEDVAVVPPFVSPEFTAAIRDRLDVEILSTTIQGSAIVGSLLAGNSHGMVVSGLARAEEIEALKEYRDVLLLSTAMNAAGNVILANDEVAVVHPSMPQDLSEEVGSFLRVPVVKTTLGGIPTVGMAGVASNKGILVHARATPQEIARIEERTDLAVGTGSVNMGSGLVGTGLIANSRGYLAGIYTSGFELGRIEEVFGFLE